MVKVKAQKAKKKREANNFQSKKHTENFDHFVTEAIPKLLKTPKEPRQGKIKKKNLFAYLFSPFNSERKIKRIIFFSALIGAATWLFWGIPLPTQLGSSKVPVSTKLYDRNGNLLYEIYSDKRSTPIKLKDVPENVKEATIAIEDKDFYRHYGISLVGIVRALYKTVFEQRLQGGSTLTQQLVKNTLLTQDRTIKRKVREFVLTIFVESLYTKDQILEMYLNQTPYGGTAYGIGSAAEIYFGKSIGDLTLSESALLAGLPQSPSRYSPFGSRPELALERQKMVLERMAEDGYITQEEKDTALLEEKITYIEQNRFQAPHFSLWIKDQLYEKYGQSVVEQSGLRVTTTLDLELQDFAQEQVKNEVEKLEKQKVGNGAAIITRPTTGEILAMVGSKDYFNKEDDGNVNVILRERQPGSSLKPLTYMFGIQEKKFTASTPFADVPTCFSSTGQALYCPQNYDGSFHGAVQTRFALGNSYNIPAVRAIALTGVVPFINYAKSLGITTFNDPTRYGLSLSLGGGEVRPFDMATAYGTVANQGIKQDLIGILKVEDYQGRVLEEVDLNDIELSGERVIAPDAPFIISHIMTDNGARSAAFGGSSQLNVKGHPEVSVKTGTTNDRRDNWTVGFTSQAVVVVWVGNNDNTPMSGAVSGVSGASPIWNKLMGEVLSKTEEGKYSADEDGHAWPKQPRGVVGATVCANNGNRIEDPNNPPCPTRFEYFLSNNIGAGVNAGNTDVLIEKTTGTLAIGDFLPELVETQNRPYLLDPLGTMVCLDCAIASKSGTIRYPLQ